MPIPLDQYVKPLSVKHGGLCIEGTYINDINIHILLSKNVNKNLIKLTL